MLIYHGCVHSTKFGILWLNLITMGNNFVLVAIAELFNPLKTFMPRYRFLWKVEYCDLFLLQMFALSCLFELLGE